VEEGKASRTAEYAASFRALETLRRPAGHRLFEDPFAFQFLSPNLQRILRLASLPGLGCLVYKYIDHRWPGAMTSGIARTRLIDDWLLDAIKDGICQIVILGAGFDCRGLRLPELKKCRVIEIDHPATQALKKEGLKKILEDLPDHVTFFEADLKKQKLSDVLNAAGIDEKQRSLVVWEGVTHYLGEKAVDATLRALSASLAPGSRLLFTYLHAGLLDGTVTFDGARASREQVSSDGEPWVWGMDPAKMPAYLAERGYQLIEDIGADDYRTRYWKEEGRRMGGFGFYRVALAEKEATGI
jgi:methyltransferase (TIGR00027 family)